MGGGCDRGKAKGRFAGGKGGGNHDKRPKESGGAGGVLARAGFGQRARHQAAVAPKTMRAAKAFGVAVGVIGLCDQLVGKLGVFIRGPGGDQGRRLDHIAQQAFAHVTA